jgi:ATP-dependent helicase/nuclease subunit A
LQDSAVQAAEPVERAANPVENYFTVLNMPVVPVSRTQAAIKNVVIGSVDPVAQSAATQPDSPVSSAASSAARIGLAMHRLLELYTPGLDIAAIAPSVGAQWGLDAAQAQQAWAAAQRITQGPAAWVWDAGVVDWQANEVELLHAGDVLRLDRLVKRRSDQTWWVLDYKSAAAPEQQSELRTQLQRYATAVREANAGARVNAAFITGEGSLVEVQYA